MIKTVYISKVGRTGVISAYSFTSEPINEGSHGGNLREELMQGPENYLTRPLLKVAWDHQPRSEAIYSEPGAPMLVRGHDAVPQPGPQANLLGTSSHLGLLLPKSL